MYFKENWINYLMILFFGALLLYIAFNFNDCCIALDKLLWILNLKNILF